MVVAAIVGWGAAGMRQPASAREPNRVPCPICKAPIKALEGKEVVEVSRQVEPDTEGDARLAASMAMFGGWLRLATAKLTESNMDAGRDLLALMEADLASEQPTGGHYSGDAHRLYPARPLDARSKTALALPQR